MNKIFLILALTTTFIFAAEDAPKKELPKDVQQKVQEIKELREQHRSEMEIKVKELKVILENYPELKKHFLEKFKERVEDRREHNGLPKEKTKE